jgi:hypothetical protein
MSSKLNIGSVIWNATTGVEVGTIVNSTQLDLKANKAQEAWIAPTLLNGWVNYGISGGALAAFIKDDMGFVHLKGLIKDGTTTAGTTIFTLPVGYRPLSSLYFLVADSNGFARLFVASNGVIAIEADANNTYLSLDQITFRAEG